MESGNTIEEAAHIFYDGISNLRITLGHVNEILYSNGYKKPEAFINLCLKNPQLFLSFTSKWKDCFKSVGNQTNPIKRDQINTLLNFVMAGTIHYLNNMSFTNIFLYDKQVFLKVPREKLMKMTENAITYSPNDIKIIKMKKSSQSSQIKADSFTKTYVKNQDCLHMARELMKNKGCQRVAVLNMSSPNFPCGSYLEGSQSQVNSEKIFSK
jgi:hypothetical protein